MVAAYVLELFVQVGFSPEALSLFALSGNALGRGMWWTLVTHLFLHANLLHLAVNVLGLWFIGPEVELTLGRGRYIALYLVSGVAGGLLQTAFAVPSSELIGASGSVCGVLLSFTTAYPQTPLQALLFFVLPVKMKARTLGWGLIGFSVLCAALHILPQIGHLAHLGGALAGAALTRWWLRPGEAPATRPLPPATTDDLLERVMEAGIEGLTREERRHLENLAPKRRGRHRGSGRW